MFAVKFIFYELKAFVTHKRTITYKNYRSRKN